MNLCLESLLIVHEVSGVVLGIGAATVNKLDTVLVVTVFTRYWAFGK